MTNTDQSQLGGVRQTLLYTLYYRALDQRSKAPIVGDTWAPEVLNRIAPGNRKGLRIAKLGASGRFPPLLRARRLDDWTRDFLARHPDASVLQLGCGLDSRAFRLDVPESVQWCDLDFPDVIELRRDLYPERAGYQVLGSSVTDTEWLAEIPVDRPTLVVAEGVLPYLTEAEVRQLFARLIDRLPNGGELIFDGVAGPTAQMTKLFHWRLGDPKEIERWNPRLTVLEIVPVVADFERIRSRAYRANFRLMNKIEAMRRAMRLVRCRF
jgi:O-methyltransferase involved in polyketide biosynthesis